MTTATKGGLGGAKAATGVGSGFSAPKTPVMPQLLPKASTTYSDWLVKQMDATLLQENSAQGAKHYREKKETFWLTFADWAASNPKELKTTLYAFMQDDQNWIFGFFPIKISKATRAIQQSLDIHQELPVIGTRKVPFRNISASVNVREKHAIYTAQGFQMDYHFMKTPDGMAAWDRMVDALTANLWSFVIYQALNEVLFEPSWYRKQNQLYPFTDVPRTVDELFDYEQRKLFILNKKPQAFHELLADSGRIMGQKQQKPSGLIMARDDLWYAHGRDPTQCYYDKSGPISIRSRTSAGNEKTVDGAKIYAVPLASGRLHDDSFSPLLVNRFQTGGFVRMRETTINLPAADYSSEKRSIRFASISKNGMTKYTLLDTLRHVPEFYPIDYQPIRADGSNAFDQDERQQGGNESHDDDVYYHNDGTDRMFDNPSSPAGQINRPLLWHTINNRKDIFERRLRTKLEGNEEYLNTLVRYNKEINNTESKMYPIDMFGEMSECNAKTKYLGHVYRTMEHAIFSDIGPEGVAKFEAGLRLAKILNRPNMKDTKVVIDIGKLGNSVTGKSSLRTSILKDKTAKTLYVTDTLANGAPVMDSAAFLKNPKEKDSLKWLYDVVTPWGLGSYSGFEAIVSGASLFFDNAVVETVREFLTVYKQIVSKLLILCPGNSCLSPKLVPDHLNNASMSDFTRTLIVAWNTLFSNAVTPNVTKSSFITTNQFLTQFTFETPNATFGHALIVPDSNIGVPSDAYIAVSFDADLYKSSGDYANANVNTEDEKMFGGTLFTALPFVHPNLPLLERSGNIGDSLRKRPEAIHFSQQRNAVKIPFRATGIKQSEVLDIVKERDNNEYTQAYYEELANSDLYKNFPASIAHMVANPLVKNSHEKVSDFEARLISSHSYSSTLGLAARAVLYSRINLQTLTAWFDNNIALPFGAVLIRPFEDQDCTSAIAVADGPIGTTYFSGMDNHVSFDPSAQHYSVQAFLHCMPVVQANMKYLMLPIVRGGPFNGGKGHLFVNQNAKSCLHEMERVKEYIETNNGEGLGNNSIIATLASYNFAIEKQETHHFDIRNNYRRENFAGRLQNAPDFVLQKLTLAYPAAPILNAIFDWDHEIPSELIEDQSFSQYMRGRARNYHVHETMCEEWDTVKGSGWVKTKSYHVWDKTEQDNCADVQTSHSSVTKSIV